MKSMIVSPVTRFYRYNMHCRHYNASISAMSNKTYGPRPKPFTLNGEQYYIGSEIGNYLMCYKGTLYKRYPQMWKRVASLEEKRQIQEMGATQAYAMSTIMLLKVGGYAP